MTLLTETDPLYELSRVIEGATELEPLLQRFLGETQRLLATYGGAVIELPRRESATSDARPAVCTLPHTLARDPCYSGFWERWSPETLDAALAETAHAQPMVTLADGCALHAFRLPGFGLLILLRETAAGAFDFEHQRGLGLLAGQLALAARGLRQTERARRQRQRLELAAEVAGIGIWEWDLDSGRLDLDDRMLQVIGLAREAFRGNLEDWIQCIHPEDQTAMRERIKDALRDSDGFALEQRIRPFDGVERVLRVQARIVQETGGLASRVLGVGMEMTATRQDQQELRQARARAESTHLAKSQLIANMSNEIRAPLNGILGLSELALDTSLNPRQREYLNLIRSSAESLLGILDDILDFAKMEAGRLRIEEIPFNFSVMVAEMAASLAQTAKRRGLELVYDPDETLPSRSLGDPGRIRQVLANLCDKAIASTEDGALRLQVRSSPSEDSQVDEIQFSIQDSRSGGLSESLRALFAAIDNPEGLPPQQLGGTGLGLSICARLITLMGGRIWSDPAGEAGGGFHFALPLPRLSPEAPPLTPLEYWPGRQALIVGDHPTERRTLAYWFKQWGFTIQEANNGLQALELARECHACGDVFDVYLFDASLPGIDGFALAEHLTAEGLAKHGRLIMLTSSGQRGDAQRCRDLGIHAFLTKPATPLELRETLTRSLIGDESEGRGPLLTRHELLEHRRRLRILLVEDNELNQKLASALLHEWGHEVVIASDGETAIERFRPAAFDLILMDLYMPGIDGIQATRSIRQREQGARRTPIIGMTANTLESDRERCLEAGMDEHILKPLQPRMLEELALRFT